MAQTHRFIYEYQYKTDSLSQEYRKDNMTLDINPDEVKFYEYNYAEIDSLNKTRDFKNCTWNDTPALKRNKNSSENTNYALSPEFFAYRTNDKMIWKLSNETKKVGEYQLQKATTHFGGRHWIAWFNKELNINEGPYKFRDLPGLIFEIEDEKQNFIFKLVKSMKLEKTYNTNDFLENFCQQKALFIDEKTLQKKKIEQYLDPLHDFKQSFKESKERGETGQWKVMNVEIKDISQFKELTEMMQKRILKENNPIELDKAIHYPILKK